MKAKKPRKNGNKQVPSKASHHWLFAVCLPTALLATFLAYGPSLDGAFLFDDTVLPFLAPGYDTAPFLDWIWSARPLLMLSFWVNYRLSGLQPFSYHSFNILFHWIDAILVFWILRRLLARCSLEGSPLEILAGFGAAIFLLHPLQTESVAYVAGRSETLSATFVLGALVAYLRRWPSAMSWRASITVLLLFGAAIATKEHTAILPALLVLTDTFWNRDFPWQIIRKNWRFYLPVSAVCMTGLLFTWKVLGTSVSAGFGLKDLSWYQYFFTQCRAVFVYVRMFFLPIGQNIDHDFPISRTIWEHGAIWALLGMLALLVLTFRLRRHFPLASYGMLVFLLLLAPTSSFVPIRDPFVEHRMCLPMIGLVLVGLEFIRRLDTRKVSVAVSVSAVVLILGSLTYARSGVWRSGKALWTDAVAKSPQKPRPRFQLAHYLYLERRCNEAASHFQTAAQQVSPDYGFLVDGALIDMCRQKWEDALTRLRAAARLQPNAKVYSLIGSIYARQGQQAQSLAALAKAAELDPSGEMAYVYRGYWHIAASDFDAAAQDYRNALALNPSNQLALDGLASLEQLQAPHP